MENIIEFKAKNTGKKHIKEMCQVSMQYLIYLVNMNNARRHTEDYMAQHGIEEDDVLNYIQNRKDQIVNETVEAIKEKINQGEIIW